MYHNVEKSAFRKGQYVGYASGVWRISKSGARWQATKGAEYIFGGTLRDISEQLNDINRRVAYKQAQARNEARLPNPFAVEGQ